VSKLPTIPEELKHVLVATPEILSGSIRFVGTRVPVEALIDTLLAGQGLEVFLYEWPDVTEEQAIAVANWVRGQALDRLGIERAS